MDCKMAQSLVIPYINDQLDDETLEGFLNHIKGCKECYEELEIYFTIQYALQKLDEDGKVSFNIQTMLNENLKASRKLVKRRKFMRTSARAVMVAAELVLVLLLFAQLDMLPDKGFQEAAIYKMLPWNEVPETETETETESETETETKRTAATERITETEVSHERKDRTD